MARYVRLLRVLLRASIQASMQYRLDFFLGGILAVFWVGWNTVPSVVVWSHRPSVAGWSFPEALVVMAWFMLLKGLLEGAINPSLLAVVEHIRKGTLDFVLLKPADAQFLVSMAKFETWRVVDALGAAGMLAYAFSAIGVWPSPAQIGAAALLLVTAAWVLYSLSILVVSTAFWVVRVDNLAYLFNSIFDAARWPSTIFRGAWQIVFTFVIPLALMTTYPAMALLGRLELSTGVGAVGGATIFALAARVIWLRSLGHYTSASS